MSRRPDRLWCAPRRRDRCARRAPDVGTEAQRESGKQLYLKYCAQCHGEKGGRRRLRHPASAPQARELHDGQVQGPHDSQRRAPDPSGPRQHHQARHALHVDARLARPLRPGSVGSRLLHHDLLPRLLEPENAPSRSSSRARRDRRTSPSSSGRSSTKRHRLRRSATARSVAGDGPSAPTLKDDWGHPIRAANLAQSWTFRGGSSREDIFRTMSTGFNGTPMPSFVRRALSPSSDGRSPTTSSRSRASNGPGYTNLVIAKHVQDPIDLEEGRRELRRRAVARFPIVGQIMEPGRAFHPPRRRVTVQAIYDAESIALLVRWHDMSAEKTGKNGPSLPVPPEERRKKPRRRGAAQSGARRSATRRSRRPRPGSAGSVCRGGSAGHRRHPSSPTRSRSRFLRRCRRAPASPTSSSATPRTRWISGSSIWPARIRFSSPAGKRGHRAERRGDLTGVASYDQGEWSVIFKRPLRPTSGAAFSPGEFMPIAFSVWDGFSRERGNRRGLTLWYSLYVEPENVPSAVGPMIRTALVILAIELALIGWVRWRHALGFGLAARGERAERRAAAQPATTRA